MNIINSHSVQENQQNIRLSNYAIGLFSQIGSRNSVKKAIKKGALLLNGEQAETGRFVKKGDRIELVDNIINPPKIYNLKFEVIFEDDYLALINKPPGVIVSGNQFKTIENSLTGNLKKSGAEDALKRPSPVHRLDSMTSGLLVIAKTSKAHIYIGRQFQAGTIRKVYKAVVHGTPPESGTINEEIEGRHASTDYSVIKTVPSLKNKTISLLELLPHTGRTHQLRIHLAGIGHPIIGDTIYGTKGNVLLHKGLFLAAVGLSFKHPVSGEDMNFTINEPRKFRTFLEREQRRWNKYNA